MGRVQPRDRTCFANLTVSHSLSPAVDNQTISHFENIPAPLLIQILFQTPACMNYITQPVPVVWACYVFNTEHRLVL